METVLLVSWKCLTFKEVRIINLDLRIVWGSIFFYKDIVLSMWNYKESSGTVFRLERYVQSKQMQGRVF